jgi:hypothetical protein
MQPIESLAIVFTLAYTVETNCLRVFQDFANLPGLVNEVPVSNFRGPRGDDRGPRPPRA